MRSEVQDVDLNLVSFTFVDVGKSFFRKNIIPKCKYKKGIDLTCLLK